MRQAGTQKQAAPQQRATRSKSKKENLSTQPTLPNTRSSFKVGDLVSVQYRGRWFPAEVRGRAKSGYNIRYADKAEEYNVAASRITIRESTATSRDATVASERCQEFEHRLGAALRPGDKVAAMHPLTNTYDNVEVVHVDDSAGKVTIKPWLGQTRATRWRNGDKNGHLKVPFCKIKELLETAEKERERQQQGHLKKQKIDCNLIGANKYMVMDSLSSSAIRITRKRRLDASEKQRGDEESYEESHEDALDRAQQPTTTTKSKRDKKVKNPTVTLAHAQPGDTSLYPYSCWSERDVSMLEGHFKDSMVDYQKDVGSVLTIFVRSDARRAHHLCNFSWALVDPHLAASPSNSVQIISIVKGQESAVKLYNERIVNFFKENDRVKLFIVDMSEALLMQQFQTIVYGLNNAPDIIDDGAANGEISILVRLDCFWLRQLGEFGCSLSQPSVLFQEPWGASRDVTEGGHHAVFTDIFYSWPTLKFNAFKEAVREVSSREAGPGEGQLRGQRLLGQWEMPRILMEKGRGIHVAIPVSIFRVLCGAGDMQSQLIPRAISLQAMAGRWVSGYEKLDDTKRKNNPLYVLMEKPIAPEIVEAWEQEQTLPGADSRCES